MLTLSELGFNKEERLAVVVLMFFSLAFASPSIWNTFDRVNQTFAGSENREVEYVTTAGVMATPSESFVIEEFFKEVNYYNYEEAKSYLLDEDSSEKFFSIFKDIYYIEAIKIEVVKSSKEGLKHRVLLNTIEKKGKSNKNFDGLDYVTVTLKRDNNNLWKIYKIAY